MNQCRQCGAGGRLATNGDTIQCESCGYSENGPMDQSVTAGWDRIWNEFGGRPGGRFGRW